jgi:predicted N-acetyltransferase YhbS
MKLSLIDERTMPAPVDAEIRRGLCICFPGDAALFSRSRAWHGSAPEFSVVLEDADRIVAHAGVVARTIGVGQTLLRVAGVQNVFVRPEYRGRGLSIRVVEAAIQEAAGRSFDAGLLFCVPALQSVYACCG